MCKHWAGVLLPPIIFAFAASVGMAEEAEEAAAPELEHVQVTATRRATTEFDVSVAITQVDAARVRTETPDVLAEMLRGLPGTYFQQTTPGQGIPIIRGLKGSQVLHLVDGMRLNNAFFRDAPNQYLGLVDAFAAERVEVIRGAAGTLYGADAMGGVINVLTPETPFEGTTWQSHAQLYGAFESADDSLIGRASFAGGRRGLSLQGGVTWQDHSDRETGDGKTIRPSAYRSEAADLKLLADIGERSELMLSAQVLEQPSTPRVDELVPGFGQDQPSSEQYLFQPNRRSFIHTRYRREGDSDWLDRLEIHAARQVITDDRLTQDFGSALINTETNKSTLDGITLQLDTTLPGGSLVTWGLEYYADEVRSARSRADPDSGAVEARRPRFPDGSSMDSLAGFVSSEWHPGDRLTLTGGLRYSAFDIALPNTPDVDAVELTPSDLTGDLRLLYAIGDNWHLVSNIGRGFRPPNVFDLATLGPRPGNRFNVANPFLEPESVWSYDFGVKAHTARLQFEVFAFYLDYRDKITSLPTGEITPEGRTVVRSENRNEVTLYGVESGMRWLVTDNTELFGVINYTRGDERNDDGTKVPGDRIPPLNGKLGLKYQADQRWQAEAYWLFASHQDRLSPRDAEDPRIDPNGTHGWGTLNLLLGWRANDSLQLGLKLENLGDVSYREHGSGIDAPGFNASAWLNAEW